MSRLRLAHVTPFLLVAAGAGLVVSAQSPGGVLSRALRSEEWTVSDWSAIRAGQLSITHGRQGDQLRIDALSTQARPQTPGTVRSAVPACEGNCYVVSAFDYGNANRLGGYFGTFGRGGSTARAALDGWDDGRRALTIDFLNTASGSSGGWIDLFSLARPIGDRVYLDVRSLQVVTFWVRGRRGAESVLLKAADAEWERREDALLVGDVGSFLPAGRITTTWQQAVVPLSALPLRLDQRTLALLAFENASAGESRIAIKNLGFCLRSQPAIPLSPPVPPSSGRPPRDRALWVWNTADILDDPAEQRSLVAFARRNLVTHLFLQLPDSLSQRGPDGAVALDAARWKALLRLLNAAGLRAHALLGSPDDARPERHQRVLATVERVATYNASAAPGERFAGIRYDIEPYLLPGFRGPRRQEILAGYLDLLEMTAARARPAGIEVGADIPFWYDSLDDLTGELPLVAYHGALKPASEHILDLVDSIAVMAYRTSAYGADSLAALADGELRYASLKGKRVFVGLETTELPDEDVLEFDGAPRRGLPGTAPADRTVLLNPVPGVTTMWVLPRQSWDAAIGKIVPVQPAAQAVPLLWWPVRRVTAVPAAKLTFARLGAARLNDVMRQVLPELAGYPSFAGFAIHDYLGYRALLESSGPAR